MNSKILFLMPLLLFFTGCNLFAPPSVMPIGSYDNEGGLLVNVTYPLDSKGNLEVAIQDQFSEIVDLKLTRYLDNLTFLDNYSIDDYIVNISTTGVVPTVSDSVSFKEGVAFFQADILAVTPLGGNNYQLTLDSPLDYAYTTEGGCSLRDNNWAKDGSVNNLIYSVSPFGLNNDTSWDIARVLLICSGDGISGADSTPDMSSFFVTDPIQNGIVFRRVDGTTKNIFTARDNFHIASEAYDVNLYPANKFGLYATSVRRTFNGFDKNGVTIRLNAITHDEFQLIVRDDLTDMTECHAVAQGHVVE